MSTEEIKAEINRVLNNFSDKQLKELLQFLKDAEENELSPDMHILTKILREDEDLLAKLSK